MKRTRIFFFLSIITSIILKAQVTSPVVLTEVMFYPQENNGEFIELYNSSATESIDIANYKFKYYTSSNNNFVSVTGSTKLLPGKFAIVLQGNYDWVNGLYKTIIPADVIILKTSGNNFGSSGMANTTSRQVLLLDELGRMIDDYTYSADNPAGYSDEKVNYDHDNSTGNWKNSTKLHGTPGTKNTVSPFDYDLRISFLSYTPAVPLLEDSVSISMMIKNHGKKATSNFSVDLFKDANSDSIGQQNENIYTKSYSSLASGDSIIITNKVFISAIGTYFFVGSVYYTPDEVTSNNKAYLKFTAVDKPTSAYEVVINEIMYGPSSDEPEWIEIINRTYRPMNLKNWKIGDNTSMVTITGSDFIFNPGDILVISSDVTINNFYSIPSNQLIVKAIPNLSNSGDDVIIRDNYNKTIDSLKYLPAWGGTSGKSLERVSTEVSSLDAANWKSSLSKFKATPSKVNSVSKKKFDLSLKEFTSSVNYAEVGKSLKVKTVIENLGTEAASNFTVKYYVDSNSNGIAEENEMAGESSAQSLVPSSSTSIEFVYTSMAAGSNNLLAQVILTNDQFTENNSAALKINGVIINELKGDLIINEIMFAPASPEPEWIEIFNRSEKPIDIKGYQIADDATKNKVIFNSLILKPEDYYVVARDSAFFTSNPGITNVTIAVFPSLNNSGDRVVLSDSLGRTIDSLTYKSNWGGAGGKSLERIDALKESTDSTNWRTSLAVKGGSPGKVNTLSKKNYDGSVTKLIYTPYQPIAGQDVMLKTEVINNGKRDFASSITLNEILTDGSKKLIETIADVNLSPGEIKQYEFQFRIINISSQRTFEVLLNLPSDEYQTDNRFSSTLRLGYNPKTVLINEIMYGPLNGEPEWIELYNTASYDIDLGDWSITDLLTTPVKTKIKRTTFPANSFLVITKDTSIINFHKTIPSKVLVNSFANLNNDADGVIIKDSRDVTIDSVRYDKSWGGESGKSIERKLYAASSVDKNNWASSKDIELSTPGRENSVIPKKYDLAILEVKTSPLFPTSEDFLSFTAKIKNWGTEAAQNYSVGFFIVNGTDTTLFNQVNGSALNPLDSTSVTTVNKVKLSGAITLLCKINFELDQDQSNNSIIVFIQPGFAKRSILISEIMYNPLDGEAEWVEFYNNSQDPINLKNWSVSDLVSPTKALITNKDIVLNPGEYSIVTSDTNKYRFYPPHKFFQVKFGALGNTSDGFIIYDYRGGMIDSVAYTSKWGGAKGVSLERISFTSSTVDSTNWTSSLSKNGATPGIPNSVSKIISYKKGALVFNEIMYDPAAGNAEFIEVYNTTEDSLQLGGMTLQAGSTKNMKLASTFYSIPPKSYVVFAADTSIYTNYPELKSVGKNVLINGSLTLTNDGAQLILRDMSGRTLDSLYYLPSWHNKNILSLKNRSLEKLNITMPSSDKSNWSSSVDRAGSTPGKQNSISITTIASTAKVSVSPNPFSPDNDGFEDFTTININLTNPISQVRIRIFDSTGRLVRTLAQNSPSASNGAVIYDGLDDSGRALRIGIYILLIEAVTNDGSTETLKAPIVIARKL